MLKKKSSSEALSGYAFILPQLLLFVGFILYPAILGFKMSLYDISYHEDIFIGLDNYKYLFSDPVFRKSLINTVIYVIGIVGLTIIFALFVATTVFDKNQKYVTFIRASYYMPVMLSMVVMSIVWNFFLNPSNGLLNYLFSKMGADGVNLLGNERTAVIVIIFVTFFGNVGQAIILYIADMIGIPKDYFEAAEIDGATRWEKITKIVIPLVKPTTLYLVITNIVAVLRIFVSIDLLTGGGPNNATVSLMYLLYQHAFEYNNTGIAAAIGAIMFVIALVLAIPQLRQVARDNK